MKCEYCDKNIRGKGVLLINIFQKPSARLFCTMKCKKDWSIDTQKGKTRKAVIWAIGNYYNKCFFLKKVINISASRREFSRFTHDLDKMERLELISQGNMKILKVSKAKI
jgi:hypothetical protein